MTATKNGRGKKIDREREREREYHEEIEADEISKGEKIGQVIEMKNESVNGYLLDSKTYIRSNVDYELDQRLWPPLSAGD